MRYKSYLPIPLQHSLSKYQNGMRLTDIASSLSTTILLATDSQKGRTTFVHIKTAMSEIKINWLEVKNIAPFTYDLFLQSKIDVWAFLENNGIWGYVYDPSLNKGKGWYWEIKYMNKTLSSVSLSDCVLRTQEQCIDKLIWRAFKLIENDKVKKIDSEKDNTPFDLKKAQKEVDGLMNLYTATAIRNAKKKKLYKTNPTYLIRRSTKK